MDDKIHVGTQKRFRSPPYPMFDLREAIARVTALHSKAHHHHVGVTVLAEAWGLKSGDGKVWRAAAALRQYGLLLNSGTGKSRKFQISDNARRIILDQNSDSERKKEALIAAAFSPMIFDELRDKFGTTASLSGSVINAYLTIDRGETGLSPYSSSAADEVLNRYRSSLAYAGIADSDNVTQPIETKIRDDGKEYGPSASAKINVGDLVKSVSGGVDQFDARKVERISPDGKFLRVIGSAAEIPMTEVELGEEPTIEQNLNPTLGDSDNKAGGVGAKPKNITASVIGGRLQLSADVAVDEIDALKNMLTKYQEILKMLN